MKHITTVLKTGRIAAASLLVFGLPSAGAQAYQAVDHSQGYKAMLNKTSKLVDCAPRYTATGSSIS
jgi:hypothetical protein